MADRRLNLGESETDARYAIEDDDTAGGDLRFLDVSGVTPTELLVHDFSVPEWDFKQTVKENGTEVVKETRSLTGGNGIDALGDLSQDRTVAIATDGVAVDELDLSIAPTWTGEHQFDAGIDIEGTWKIDSEAKATVERLRIQGTGVDDPAELFLQAKGASNVSRFTATPDSDTSNFSGVTLETNGTQQVVGSVAHGTATPLPLQLRMDGTPVITIGTDDSVTFDQIAGTPTMAGHDHTAVGMTAIPNAGLANSSVTVAGQSVSLGGSTAVSVDDLSDVASATEAAGQLPIWNATAGEYQNAALTGGNAISVTNADASVTLAVPTDGIQTDELDLSIAPTWTGAHTFNAGITMGGNIVPGTNATHSVGTAAAHFSEMHATAFITHSPEPRSLESAAESIRSYAAQYGSMDMADMIADLVTVVREQQLLLDEVRGEVYGG